MIFKLNIFSVYNEYYEYFSDVSFISRILQKCALLYVENRVTLNTQTPEIFAFGIFKHLLI